jgi:hypothetical protein
MFIDSVIQIGFRILSFLHMCQPQRRVHETMKDETPRTGILNFTHMTISFSRSIYFTCNVYNMSGRVVSDIQTRAEGESLYIRYNTDANVVNNLKNDSSYKFIGEVILKINVV